MQIPLFRPAYNALEMRAVHDVLRSGWSGMGPKVKEFEERFASLCGAKHAVALNSCTAALEIAYRFLLTRGCYKAVVPALTFVSTAMAARCNGLSVKFDDVQPDTMVRVIPDREPLAHVQTIVHYGGRHWKQDGFNVIHDAAHCSPLEFKQPPHGIVCWSFESKKVISCGDGGMITTNDDKLAEKARIWRWCGITSSTWDRSAGSSYKWDYDVSEAGGKYHMNDIAAAIGLCQLDRLPLSQESRRHVYDQYANAFRNKIPFLAHDDDSAKSLFVIQVANRNELFRKLLEDGITTGVHYKPLYRHTHFASSEREATPVTEAIADKILSLPMFPMMMNEEIDVVVNRVLRYAEV